MSKDAKWGFVVGLCLVVTIAIVFFRRGESPSEGRQQNPSAVRSAPAGQLKKATISPAVSRRRTAVMPASAGQEE